MTVVKKIFHMWPYFMAAAFAVAVVMSFPGAARADVSLDEGGIFKAFGDLRLRYESDWQSKRSNGTSRDDRQRFRIRARAGLKIYFSEDTILSFRVRTGSTRNQQSPHVTLVDFSTNGVGRQDALVDKAFIKSKFGKTTGWIGRNGFPFWKQNELFWDDDATILGAAAVYKGYELGGGKLGLRVGAFALPDGMRAFQGDLLGAQVTYDTSIADTKLTAAGGYYHMGGAEKPAVWLNNNNGNRDYDIMMVSVRAQHDFFGLPFSLGVDGMHNFQDYSASDVNTFTATHEGEVDGVDVQLRIGKMKKQGDWLVGYSYAWIETFAVNASYAQDDWMRWGSADQTDASDFKGSEFRVGYMIMDKINALARLYIVDAISTSKSGQDGTRFRFDINMKF